MIGILLKVLYMPIYLLIKILYTAFEFLSGIYGVIAYLIAGFFALCGLVFLISPTVSTKSALMTILAGVIIDLVLKGILWGVGQIYVLNEYIYESISDL
ncbi:MULTISPECIES: hypothetical protein [unclassified Butyrivibrio]|uniref:hypothetical protein n=1 Tax=unclassified Butyrivibrio TaxID=2639466 RepID=UPI00047E42D7|nr:MULTISPECIES: hypothetical protein [unclassified Butyrivibrio]